MQISIELVNNESVLLQTLGKKVVVIICFRKCYLNLLFKTLTMWSLIKWLNKLSYKYVISYFLSMTLLAY